METLHVGRSSGEAVTGPDHSWRELYQAGGASALFYVVFGMLVPEVLFLTSPYDTNMSGAATLYYIASHQAWWIIVQVLSLGLSIVAMVVLLALLMALKHLNKGYAAIGTVIMLTSQVIFCPTGRSRWVSSPSPSVTWLPPPRQSASPWLWPRRA